MTVHLVMPEGLDDPARPSGGNTYDRRLADGLRAHGRGVREHLCLPGDVATTLASVPDGSTVVVDGLVGCFAPRAIERHADRLRIVLLAHMSFGEAAPSASEDERRAVRTARSVVTVSAWTRDRLLARYGADPARLTVVEPGADPAPRARRTRSGRRLLCVGPVSTAKGHDVLLEALSLLGPLDPRLTCVGRLDTDPGLARRLRHAGARLTGPLPARRLAQEYAAADLLVLPTRSESFGIVVLEALARGLPVLASDVGGVPEALGTTADGRVAGTLVRPGDAAALAGALRRWLTDAGERSRLRAAADVRRETVRSWDQAVDDMDRLLHRTPVGAPR